MRNFLLSGSKNYRQARHLVFWAVYCTFFFVQSIMPIHVADFYGPHLYWSASSSLACFIPVCIFSVYVSIYYILPRFLYRKKYLRGAAAFIVLLGIDVCANYFFSSLFLRSIDYQPFYDSRFLTVFSLGYYNVLWAFVISGLALGLKLTRQWYLQQQETLEMLKRKSRTELRIQKAHILPEFLYGSLDGIYKKISTGSSDSSGMVVKLSDLLSYSLYDAEEEMVPLEKELTALEELISIEQMKPGNSCSIDLQTEGDTSQQLIPPVLILSVLQDGITILKKAYPGSKLVTLFIHSQSDDLYIGFSFYDPDGKIGNYSNWSVIIRNIKKRLDAIYEPGTYLVKTSNDSEQSMFTLTISLKKHDIESHYMKDPEKKGGVHEFS